MALRVQQARAAQGGFIFSFPRFEITSPVAVCTARLVQVKRPRSQEGEFLQGWK